MDSEDGKILGFRLLVEGDKAGELVVKLRHGQKTLQIQLLMVERGFRKRGCGTGLLRSAEKIASAAQFDRVALTPYSLDKFNIQDSRLRRWYASRGYRLSKRMMYRDIKEGERKVVT